MGKKAKAETVFHEALGMVDELHLSIVELADLAGVKDDRPASIRDEGAKLPRAQFVIDGDDAPERGGLAFDTRMVLCLTVEQGQAVLLELARAIRETRLDHEEETDEQIAETEFELELDGRIMLKPAAAREIRSVLEEED